MFQDPSASPDRGVGEPSDVPTRVHLRVERAVRRPDDRVGQDRRQRARLVAIDETHVDAVGLALRDELREGRGLRLGVRVDETTLGPQTEVVVEHAGQLLQFTAQVHDQLELRAWSPGVEPDVAEVAAGRAVGEVVRFQQRHRCTAKGEVIRRRGAHDAAADDQDVGCVRHVPPIHARGPTDGADPGHRRYQPVRQGHMCSSHSLRTFASCARHSDGLGWVRDDGTAARRHDHRA